MRPIRISLLLVLLAAFAGTAQAQIFVAQLSGDQEVPPVSTDTVGRFMAEFSGDFDRMEFRLDIRDGRKVTQAHIHCAPAGSNGPVVLFLAGFNETGFDVDGKWMHWTGVTDANVVNPVCGATLADLAESMRAGNTYVNVHTVDFPPGEVRGQIRSVDDD